jgi:cation transport ATPase
MDSKKEPNRIKSILLISAIALVISFVWEMIQMPFYQGMYFSDPNAWLVCLQASGGDVFITLFIFLAGCLVFKSWFWHHPARITRITYLVLMGAVIAVAIEIWALKAGRWSYSPLMPVIPGTGIGVVPIVQLIFLPYLSYF